MMASLFSTLKLSTTRLDEELKGQMSDKGNGPEDLENIIKKLSREVPSLMKAKQNITVS